MDGTRLPSTPWPFWTCLSIYFRLVKMMMKNVASKSNLALHIMKYSKERFWYKRLPLFNSSCHIWVVNWFCLQLRLQELDHPGIRRNPWVAILNPFDNFYCRAKIHLLTQIWQNKKVKAISFNLFEYYYIAKAATTESPFTK